MVFGPSYPFGGITGGESELRAEITERAAKRFQVVVVSGQRQGAVLIPRR
jgi:hypothetical protein